MLIEAPTEQAWACSHAALPAPEAADPNNFYLYYSPRDDAGRAHIARARIEVVRDGHLAVAGHDSGPVLSPGPVGTFDDGGVTVSCVVEGDAATFLYYTGWMLGVSVPFYFYVGLATRAAGERVFTRVSQAPVLERNAVDPYLTASPWVLREGGTWRMWYVSCVGWRTVSGKPQHRYHLRYAESNDGIAWRREGRVAIDFINGAEYAISRPCVIKDGSRYRMWFAARGKNYRLGYAESSDGLNWARDDRLVGLEPAGTGWDGDMVAYPAIVDHGRTRYLLYNGDDYGRTGIGYAVADTET